MLGDAPRLWESEHVGSCLLTRVALLHCFVHCRLQTASRLCASLPADSKAEITLAPQPSEQEIQFILDAIAEYLTVAVRPAGQS